MIRESSRSPASSSELLSRRETLAWVVAFLVLRGVLLAAFLRVTGGREVASDVDFHAILIARPWATLLGQQSADVASYPPLQGLIEAPLFAFFALMTSDTAAFRLMFGSVELVSLLIVIALLNASSMSGARRRLIAALFILAPQQYLASQIFAQDEVIAQAFVLGTLLLLVRGHRLPALLVLAVGVCAGKIFLVVPLGYLWAFHEKKEWRVLVIEALAIASIIGGVHGLAIVNALRHGGAIPFVGFTPFAEYASNAWVIAIDRMPEHIDSLKRASLLLSAIAQVLLFATLLVRHLRSGTHHAPAALLAVPLALLFATFFQHMPEYLLMLWPCVLFLRMGVGATLLSTAIVALAWLPRLLFGLKNIGIVNATSSNTRNELLGDFVGARPLDLPSLHFHALWLYTLLYTLLAGWLIFRLCQDTRLRAGASS